MEWLLAVVLLILLGYLIYGELVPTKPIMSRKRLCDYYVQGSVFEDPSQALQKGVRLLELHVYADEAGYPVVAKKPLNEGYDYAEENWTFEHCCVAIANDAFPSSDPLILSIVPHTTNVVTLNRVAEHLKTTVHRHLIDDKDVFDQPVDKYANKIILVSGGDINGTDLDELINLSWNGSHLRRLEYNQAIHPRDQPELVAFNRTGITLVAPDYKFGRVKTPVEAIRAYGCQWNLFVDPQAKMGFEEKPAGLQ